MSIHALKVKEEDNHQRLDVFLSHALPEAPSRTFVKKLIDFNHVKVNEKQVKPHYKVCCGDDVFVEIPQVFLTPQYIEPEDIPLDIFYEDEYLLVINKPTGMLVHPASKCYTGTLVNALLHYSSNLSNVNTDMRPGIVHRLDQETSGLLLVAKDNITHTKLAKQFQRHTIRKCYMALTEGEIEFDQGMIDAPIGRHSTQREKKAVQYDDSAKDSKTFYKVIKRHKNTTLVSLYPRTGRTHQLRVHLKHIGHPILGDSKYGKKTNFPRLALHAQSIGFKHPFKKYYLELSSKPPEVFFEKVNS